MSMPLFPRLGRSHYNTPPVSNYDAAFFDYVNSGSVSSAQRLLPAIREALPIASVLDVGCGQGAWLSVWKQIGVEDILGIDGDYVERDRLLIPESRFKSEDLSRPFSLGRKFDLVQSLEVAEHLPKASAASFVKQLCGHGEIILFSAAPPGQGGDHHINEQSYEFWRELFQQNDYHAFDFVRPLIANHLDEVEPWYRYNTFLYVAHTRVAMLPEPILATLVPETTRLTDVSPPLYRLRKVLVNLLPVSLMTRVAKVKERYVARKRLQGSAISGVK